MLKASGLKITGDANHGLANSAQQDGSLDRKGNEICSGSWLQFSSSHKTREKKQDLPLPGVQFRYAVVPVLGISQHMLLFNVHQAITSIIKRNPKKQLQGNRDVENKAWVLAHTTWLGNALCNSRELKKAS